MAYISHLLMDEEMKDVISQTGAGVESIEFSISENLDSLREKIFAYRKRMKWMGVEDLTLHGPFLDLNPAAFDSEIQRVTKLRFAQCYEAAVELGAKKIIYHSCYYPQVYFLQGWAPRVADFMNDFLRDRKDIQVLMENVLDPKWQPVAEVAQLVEAENFGICLDVGHANCYSEENVCEWTRGLAPYIKHLHVHDNMGQRDSHSAVGKGNIPFAEIAQILKGREDISWTVECNSKEDVLESLKKFGEMF